LILHPFVDGNENLTLFLKKKKEMNREMSRSSERRIASITNACEEFDHWETEKHDIELLYGAAVVLTKLLINTDDDENELRMILAATEMVFRASPKAISNALQPGKPTHSLSQQLIKLWDYLDSSSMEASQHSISHADISTLNIAKIIHSISRCTDLRTMLLQIPALLEILIRETELSEEKVWRMRILANIANHEDCKVIIFEYHGILEFVLRAGHFETNDWSRQYAAKILMELSSSPANQISMAKIQTVLGTLVKMVFLEKSSDTRKSAISCLQNLAFTKENRIRLVQFKNGLVLEALKKSMTADLDEKARRRAAGTLTNIACAETAEALGTHKGLLETLAIVVTKDPSLHVQSRAALALTKIACFITVDMTCHEMLLDALVAASLSKAATTVSSVLRVKARAPENRQALARHPGIMDTLCDWICSNGSSNTPATTDRDNAVRAIMHLVNDETNRKTLCNKTVLAVLVQAANYEDPNLEEARDSAIRALQRLATDISNRHTMGHFEGLITAIAKAAEREAHWEQIGQETEYGCLAKPLLMTLLISM
jgi:hypothetical protein